jgi:hypothetical protein
LILPKTGAAPFSRSVLLRHRLRQVWRMVLRHANPKL